MSGSTSRFLTEEQRQAQQRQARLLNEERPCICPNCGGHTYFMGLDFKAPKVSDIKAWREVEAFIRSGKTYYRGTA